MLKQKIRKKKKGREARRHRRLRVEEETGTRGRRVRWSRKLGGKEGNAERGRRGNGERESG